MDFTPTTTPIGDLRTLETDDLAQKIRICALLICVLTTLPLDTRVYHVIWGPSECISDTLARFDDRACVKVIKTCVKPRHDPYTNKATNQPPVNSLKIACEIMWGEGFIMFKTWAFWSGALRSRGTELQRFGLNWMKQNTWEYAIYQTWQASIDLVHKNNYIV